MDISADVVFPVDEFTLELASDRTVRFDMLLYKGRRVTEIVARVIEAQFRMPDGSTLLLLNDDTRFEEALTLLLVSPALRELDRVVLGGAFTPGYLTYAYPSGPDSVAFCWHDLDQVVTVGRRRTHLGLRTRWLRVREAGAAGRPGRLRMLRSQWSRRRR